MAAEPQQAHTRIRRCAGLRVPHSATLRHLELSGSTLHDSSSPGCHFLHRYAQVPTVSSTDRVEKATKPVDIGPERWRHCCTHCKLHSAVVHLMQQLTTAALAVTQCNTANKEHSPTIYKYAMSASRRLISHPTGFPPVLTAPSHHAAVLINTKTLVNLRSIVHRLLC